VEGRGDGDNEKGVGEVNAVNGDIVDIVVDRDCEPRRWEQLTCGYAASRCSSARRRV